MNDVGITKQDWRLNLLRWAVIASATAIIGYSLLELFTREISKTVVVGVAALIAVLIARFDLPIPGTRSTFHPKTVFAFWGIASLGVYGGALLALAASFSLRTANRENWLAHAARDIVTARGA